MPFGAKRVYAHASQADRNRLSRMGARTVSRRQCADVALRKRLEKDPPRWIKTFFARRFNLEWAPYHLDIIHDSLYAIKHGTNQLIVAPRGGGKSRPVMAVVFFAVLTRQSPFPVYAPWKSEAVDAAFRFWLGALANNKELADLYPEFCDPFREAKGNPQKLNFATWDDTNEPTGARMAVSDGLILMPDSLGIIGSTTVNGNPLGMAYDSPDGKTTRPTIIFLDDPEDDKTAISQTLTDKTVRKIDADFGGMGGPDTKLAMIMCATVKGRSDVTTHYMHDPEWNVKATPRVTSWPDGWDKAESPARRWWAEWAVIRQEGLDKKDKNKAALAFYVEHKAEMTAGMAVSWNDRFDRKKKEPDALYSTMWDYYRLTGTDGQHAAFFSEHQNEPLEEGSGDRPYTLTADLICSRVADREPGVVPEWVAQRIASTDLNPSYALTSAVVGFGRDQTAAVTWYGLYTAAPLPIRKDVPEAERHRLVYAALVALGKQLAALPCRPELWGIDASGEYFPTVLRFCAEAPALCGLNAVACTGQSGKNYKPYGKNVLGAPREWCHMRSDVQDGRRRKWLAWHADYWREVAQRAWLGAVGSPGGVSLFKGHHGDFATQVCREQLHGKGDVGGQTFWNWHTAPGPHDYGDVMGQAYALAAWGGIGTGGQVQQTHGPRRPRGGGIIRI